ncbi:MAG: endopeptidase La [Oscillospiraceae bacterium]
MDTNIINNSVDIKVDNEQLEENKTLIDSIKISMPLIAMRGLVMFPKMVLHFDVGRDKSILALNAAMKDNRLIMLVAQKDLKIDEPTDNDLYRIGVVAEIKQIVKAKGETLRVIVEGMYRGVIDEFVETTPFFKAVVSESPLKEIRKSQELKCSALLRTVKDLFEEYCELSPRMPNDLVGNIIFDDDYINIAEYVAGNMPIQIEDKQKILAESCPIKRLECLAAVLDRENDILSLEKDIYDKVKDQVDKNQREYYLREQLKAITTELNEGDDPTDEGYKYMDQIYKLHLSVDNEEKLINEAKRMMRISSNSSEGAIIRNYLDTCLSLPWNKSTTDKIDIKKAKEILDKEHYGMQKVKNRILELLAVRKLSSDISGQIICLVGPPGIGKTSIAKSVAKTLGRKYARMSLGGLHDEADIRGHRKTYIGAMPGRIITALKQAKSNNALILLDEIDKLGNDFKGDPSSALLEVLDSEQNNAFVDHYIEIPFDLSKTLFLATANDLSAIPAPLRDRMEIIELTSYTRDEKFNIAKNYLVNKQIKRIGLKLTQIKFSDEAILELIDYYTRESGVRSLEREIASISRKVARDIVSGEEKRVLVNAEVVQKYLGSRRFKPELIGAEDEIGLVNGLAWTSVGGEMLQIEVAILEGTGKIELTGQLGDVMKESARTAVSYIRSCCSKYNIDGDFYKNKDIHLHIPEGAVPKDGPSAGVSMCTALISALGNIPVKHDVAMTGEITLRGRVMAIGGLKEKAMAAHRAGIKTIIIPEDNKSDIEEIDEIIRKEVQFITANHIETVLENALIMPEKISESELTYTVINE